MEHHEADLIERDIDAYLVRHQHKELLRLLTCGSVDDGKSTLIGRLLHDTKLIYEDQLAAIKRDSAREGSSGEEMDLALLVDGLQAEREQGITIDVAYRYFSTDKRKFIIADTPGHEQYTRNMATGASTCDLAVILIDARHGVLAQTKRHSFICGLLGIRHVVVAVNKMDLVDYDEAVYERIRRDYLDFAARLDIQDIRFVPVSALKGDNVVDPSAAMPWYQQGPLLDYLETVHVGSDRNMIDLRFPVQYVIRPDLHFRGYAGTLASGLLRPGDEVQALPSGVRSRVKDVHSFEGPLSEAFPPLAVTVTLEDEVDVSRGDMLVHPSNQPRVARDFEAMIVWMADEPMLPGRQYFFKHTTNLVGGSVQDLRYRVDVNTLHSEDADALQLNEVGRCHVTLNRAIPFDSYRKNRSTGAFAIIDRQTNGTVGAGMIVDRKAGEPAGSFWEAEPTSEFLQEHFSPVSSQEREARFEQKPATILLTGLTGAGKTTIAYQLERRLFDSGRNVTVLDGENLRRGMSRDLGFTAPERSENLRRAAELARVLNDGGAICIAAFTAPDRGVRERVREVIGGERFIEVFVSAPIDLCRERDPNGMYERADRGEIEAFPGVSAPYEEPAEPSLTLQTEGLSPDDCVDQLMRLLEQRGIIAG